MRADMHHVVIERPRSGSSSLCYHDVRTRHNGNDLDSLDALPKHESYRRPHVLSGRTKEFSDFFSPVQRFVHSHIGEKWDDVFAEICEHINLNNDIQHHLLTHIYDCIEIDTALGVDGEIYRTSARFSRWRPLSQGEVFVHPVTGLICEIPVKSRSNPRYAGAVKSLRNVFGNDWHSIVRNNYHVGGFTDAVISEAKRHLWVGPEQDLHKIDGIWYWAVYKDVPPPWTMHWVTTGEPKSRIVRCGGVDFLTKRTHNEGRYRFDKRQASRRDLRRHKLWNE